MLLERTSQPLCQCAHGLDPAQHPECWGLKSGLVLPTSFLAVLGRNLSYVVKLEQDPLFRHRLRNWETQTRGQKYIHVTSYFRRIVRLRHANTHSSSLMESQQESHMRTWNSKPMTGQLERLLLHFPQTACPHFLQWCFRGKRRSFTFALMHKSGQLQYLTRISDLTILVRYCFLFIHLVSRCEKI